MTYVELLLTFSVLLQIYSTFWRKPVVVTKFTRVNVRERR